MNDDLLPWRLYKKLTIGETAFLLCGVAPNSDPTLGRPPQYVVWVEHIQRAISKEELSETMRYDGPGLGSIGGVIMVDDLRDWLKGKGVTTGFFFDAPVGLEAQQPNGNKTESKVWGKLLKSKEELKDHLGFSMGKLEELLQRYPFQDGTGVTGKVDGGWRVYTSQADQWLTWVQIQETLAR